MDAGQWIAAISACTAIASAFIAWRVWCEAKKVGRFQLLIELIRDYAESEMHKHVSSLWCFHDKCKNDKKDIREEFRRELDSADQPINSARRQVTHFYQRMAVLREAKVANDKLLYRHWSTSDLDIIPKILVPLQTVVYERHNEVLTNQLDLLCKLHEDSKLWWQTLQ